MGYPGSCDELCYFSLVEQHYSEEISSKEKKTEKAKGQGEASRKSCNEDSLGTL
jgi:hypothetical protein